MQSTQDEIEQSRSGELRIQATLVIVPHARCAAQCTVLQCNLIGTTGNSRRLVPTAVLFQLFCHKHDIYPVCRAVSALLCKLIQFPRQLTLEVLNPTGALPIWSTSCWVGTKPNTIKVSPSDRPYHQGLLSQ